MAKIYWLGTADAVTQVHTGSIDSLDGTPANNTFTVTIGDVSISQAGVTDVATTAAALVALLNASTHPYFEAITWTNPSAGNIVATADTAGVPFVSTLTETGAGTGAVTDFSETTANAGPNDYNTADNWSTGSVPASSDDVIFEGNSINVCWGLDQSAVDLASLTIEASYNGKIGLNRSIFATSSDGETGSATVKDEYRDHYLKIGWATSNIGQNFGPNQPNGSQRLKLNNVKAGTSVTTIHKTASASSESSQPPVRLLFVNANADIYCRTGNVGIAVDEPGETSTVGIVSSSGGNFYIGEGVTITEFSQNNGTSFVQAAATVATINAIGGTLTLEGEYTVTTLNVNGATVNANNTKSAGNAITTVNVNSGTLDGTNSSEPRTWATVNPNGGSIISNDDVVTITTFNQPAGSKTLNIS